MSLATESQKKSMRARRERLKALGLCLDCTVSPAAKWPDGRSKRRCVVCTEVEYAAVIERKKK